MSLSSTELNYLVWRYLQESGFDLAAYAFDKQALCLTFEDNKPPEVLAKVESGFLVNLVQKGLLYSLTEEELRDNSNRSEILTFFGSLLKEEKDIKLLELGHLQEMAINSNGTDASKNGGSGANDINLTAGGNPNTDTDAASAIEFHTKVLTPVFTYNESLLSKWHPSSNVLAFIKEDSSLLISAINDNKIVETASLKGPGLDKVNEITALSWSPLGNLVTTANVAGDLCSWSPDGNLRNITKGIVRSPSASSATSSAIILDITWSPSGLYFVTSDSHGRICLWNSTNLNLIQEITPSTSNEATAGGGWGFCWLSDLKFAISVAKNSIKIMTIVTHGIDYDIKMMADLQGHEGIASHLKFDEETRLLASSSAEDNLIKLWLLNSSSPEVATLKDDSSKMLPLISLDWIPTKDHEKQLIGVSIDGTIRLWNSKESQPLQVVNIFKDEGAYKFNEEDKVTMGHGSLIYSCALSPSGKWLVIGDDTGRITVWDVTTVKCRAIFDHFAADGSILDPESGNGVCDISWDNNSTSVSVSYKGTSSVVLTWNES